MGGKAADGSTRTPHYTTTTSSSRRRARSVSRFSHRLLPELDRDFVESTPRTARTRGNFVNTSRGAAFPEVSLDDLAIELFSSGGNLGFGSERGLTSSDEVSGSGRRGRLESRQSSKVGGQRKSVVSGRVESNGNCDRRNRSLSVVRYRGRDSEKLQSDGDSKKFSRRHNNAESCGVGSKVRDMVSKPTAIDPPRGLHKCSSQRDMLRSHDGYSSHSSALTDDESNDARYGSDYLEKSTSNYSRNKPEMRKQERLNQIVLEERHGNGLRRTCNDLSESNGTSFKRPSRARRRNDDRRQISQHLDDDVEKIIEDFISSVEDDTDISSINEERSDTSSAFGVTARYRDNPIPKHFGEIESQRTAPGSTLAAVEMDGVVLPWLQWDASNDTPQPCKVEIQVPATPNTVLQDALKEKNTGHEQHSQTNSSRGSWSPVIMDGGFSADAEVSSEKTSRIKYKDLASVVKRRSRPIDIDDYVKSESNEDFILERWNQRERISSGGMLMCQSSFRGMFLF